jgi:hypothetical protein
VDTQTRKLDVAKWLAQHDVEVYAVERMADGGSKWKLAACPFDESHRNGDAAIFQTADGKLGAKCFHASCAGRGWTAFRKRIGPLPTGGTYASRPTGPEAAAAPSDRYDLELVSNADLFDDDTEVRFLVEGILAAEQPCILGGAGKTLKTSLAVDLAVSMASGDPFLGRFAINDPGPVLFVSAESGKPVLRDVMRACCWSKNVDARELPIHWSFRRPNLTNLGHLASLLEAIETHRPKLIILDPTYLLLLGGGDAERTKNLFAMGNVLGVLTDAVCSTGATLMLLHHVTKGVGRGKREPISLGDLAYAGFSEWARQWVLVSRWEDYEPGTGQHALHLSVGGSAGHSGAWVARIDEGRPTDPLIGRLWSVTLQSPSQAVEHPTANDADSRAALTILRAAPNGLTKTQFREANRFNNQRAGEVLENLMASFAVRSETTNGKTVYLACEDLG